VATAEEDRLNGQQDRGIATPRLAARAGLPVRSL
jgi:hypothetical protein